MVVTLLTHREIHFSDPLRRIWGDDPFVGRYSDTTMETMLPIGGSPTCRGTTLGHHIQGCVGASSIERWIAGGHGVAWWCTIECGTALWSRSILHHIESMRRVTDAWTRSGHEMVQGANGIQQYTEVCLSVQWHVEECMDDQWYARAHGATQQGLRALLPERLMDRDTGLTFGGISPGIDGQTEERYLAVSVGTHTPDSLRHHS